MPLRIIPDNTKIPFMRLARIRTPISLALIVLSFVLLFTVGLNQGIDFKGGTVIEVQSNAASADLADILRRGCGAGFAQEMQDYDRLCHVWYPARPFRRCDPSRV